VLLAQDDWDQAMCGYRVDGAEKPIKSYLFRWSMHSDLIALLRGDPPHRNQTNFNQMALL
jgi:hypothetical protein